MRAARSTTYRLAFGSGLAAAAFAASACGDEHPSIADGGVDDSAPAADHLCSGDWCWESPGPQGNDLHAVWSFGPSDVWAAGADATVLHWDGAAWSYAGPLRPGESEAGYGGMWASGPLDLWMWGSDGVWRWDGASWSATTPDDDRQVQAVFGTGPTSVLAVGDNGLFARWDGAAWTVSTVGAGSLLDVWAAGDEIWAVGVVPGADLEHTDSELWHHDGETWTSEIRGEAIAGLWGAAVDDVYAFGGSVMHWDGAAWTPLDLPIAVGNLWGTSATDVWAFDASSSRALHHDGRGWRAADLPAYWSASAVAGTGASEAWIVGREGRIARWDGASWTRAGGPTLGSELALPGPGMWGEGGRDLWTAGRAGGVVHFDGERWSADSTAGAYASVWGEGGSLWAVGGYGARAYRHEAIWDASNGDGTPHFYGVWASSATDAWAVGDAIYHHDGDEWTAVRDLTGKGVALRDVWGRAADDVWAVGDAGTVLRWDGSAWQDRSTEATHALATVWGFGTEEVWAAGSRYDGAFHPVLLRRDGAGWTEVPAPSDEGIADALWGSAVDDVWLSTRHTGSRGGQVSMLHHWDGAGWTEHQLPIRQHVSALWGWARDRVAVVSNGGLLRYRPSTAR